MNRIILGAFGALMLVTVGLFWMQGRAQVEAGAPPPDPAALSEADRSGADDLPSVDVAGMEGPEPPEATDLTREQRRFFRYDRNRDLKITRNEMLSTRTDAFRKLDTDGNNLLTFEEWAATTVTRFDAMDANGNRELNAAEFASSAPKPRKATACKC